MNLYRPELPNFFLARAFLFCGTTTRPTAGIMILGENRGCQMNQVLRVAIAGLAALSAAGCLAQSAGQMTKVGELQVKEVNLAEIDASHVKLAVVLGHDFVADPEAQAGSGYLFGCEAGRGSHSDRSAIGDL